jgi:hypothetical protein
MARLKAGGITLNEILKVSMARYKKADNKAARSREDITNAKLYVRKNYSYDKSRRMWVQEPRKEVRLEFMVRSRPTSYKVPAWQPAKRQYPVTFIIRDMGLGMDSPFKWRTGSLKKPSIPPPKAGKFLNERAALSNIKRGIQMQFFFELSHVVKRYGLLHGPDWSNRAPKKTNPSMDIFFDKHAYMIARKVLQPLFRSSRKDLLINKIFKNI